MPTVKELINEYGEGLVGRRIRLNKDRIVIFKGWNTKYQKVVVDEGRYGIIISDDTEAYIEPEITIKTPFHLLDLSFAAAMCRCFEEGIKDGRKANDWKELPKDQETFDKYKAKILRHLKELEDTNDPKHAAAIACCANILWCLNRP
jgi:hypothetical protein